MAQQNPHLARRFCVGLWLIVMVALIAAGCLPRNDPLPTVANIPMGQTAAYLTQNAPPPGFGVVNFAPIDKNLERLPHWHYLVSLSFEGTFADTKDPTTGTISAELFSNELAGTRRVVLRASGDAFGETAERNVEGVRLGNEYYFVDQNKTCSRATDDPNRRRVAALTAGELIGGIKVGTHMPTRREADGITVFQYAFLPGDVDPPVMQVAQGGSVTIASGELWIAPSLGVVRDYALTLTLRNVILPIFQGDRQLSGTLTVVYTLVEVDTAYSIAIPYGC
ncbi:MAG TPA: hypothetical protein PLD47_17820 [Aggregatilineales bacterium]|nr:hypothetical protein [Anaerolineales bacterium]HRE49587.1 hypothetical protein [Aggregatilineales bacterium]